LRSTRRVAQEDVDETGQLDGQRVGLREFTTVGEQLIDVMPVNSLDVVKLSGTAGKADLPRDYRQTRPGEVNTH
jgi:hypothetical protein